MPSEKDVMTSEMTAHPHEERLLAYSKNELPPGECDVVKSHLELCAPCRQKLENSNVTLHAQDQIPSVISSKPAETTKGAVPPELVDHARYRIVAPLGEGGMGVVFKAEHKMMGRVVALKVINKSLTANQTIVERFLREVRAAAKLSHPNIVTAYDAEEANGLHFLAMEFVDGISLDRYVARQKGPIPVAMACHFIRQAALGLQHAHQRGMVHRDIKPQNLMLTRQGVVKILDFGLARLTEENIPDGVSTPNIVVGTPDYLAPEQANDSHNVDIRADIYALGCSLFFLLAKRVPFPRGSAMEKLVQHISAVPEPIGNLRSDLPADLVEVIGTMMAKQREDRYQTPADVAAALVPFLKKQPSTTEMSNAKPANAVEDESEDLRTDTEAVEYVPDEADSSAQLRSSGKRKRSGKKRKSTNPWGGRLIAVSLAIMVAVLVVAAVEKFTKNNSAKPSKVTTPSGDTKQPADNYRTTDVDWKQPEPVRPAPEYYHEPPDRKGPDGKGPEFKEPRDRKGPPDDKEPPDRKGPPDGKGPPDRKGPPDGKGPKFPPPDGKGPKFPPPDGKEPKLPPPKKDFPGKKDFPEKFDLPKQ